MSDRNSGVDVDAMVDKWLEDGASATEGEDSSNAGETPDAPPTPDSQAEGAAPTDGQAAQDGTTKQPDGQPPKPADNAQPAAQQAPKAGPGDLVDRDGKLLAKAGPERRHYEAAQRASRDLQTTRGELQRVSDQLNAFRQAAQLPTQLGLSPDESTTGLQLMASWKQNPVGVLQYLVEQAKAAGHNLDTLGGGSTDMGAIKTMLAQELAPFRQQAQAVQQQTEATTAAQRDISNLTAEYGEAALVNSEALSKLIDAAGQQGKPLGLEQAYLRFSNWCLANQFDPHQPIDPQIAARRTQQQAPQPATQQRTPPRPNGRAVAAPTGVVPMDSAANVTGNETTRDLVKMAMREAGFNV